MTIDDFPCVGPRSRSPEENIRLLTQTLVKKKVPATGFIVGEQGPLKAMRPWLDAGLAIGNHTFSHGHYSLMSTNSFLADVQKNIRIIQDQLGVNIEAAFFRFPYLDHGNTEEKVGAMEQFLEQSKGRLAHVSLDTMDYRFAAVYGKKENKAGVRELYLAHLRESLSTSEKLSQKIFGRIIPMILLIHANELNADCLEDLLRIFKEEGYTFVSLDQAVGDKAFQPFTRRPPLVRCRGDKNFLHQMAVLKGIHASENGVQHSPPAPPDSEMSSSGEVSTGGSWFKKH